MGDAGEVSRICAAKFGSPWTYAGSLPGIGQLSPRPPAQRIPLCAVTAGRPRSYGIVGLPVSHSVSPAMHNAAFRATGIDAVYVPLPAADIGRLRRVRARPEVFWRQRDDPVQGRRSRVSSDDVDPLARRVGAVNTIRVRDGRWEGMNSDVAGFLRPLRDRGVPLAGTRAAVLGAGGSARAVVTGLSTSRRQRSPCSARNPPRAVALARSAEISIGPFPPLAGILGLASELHPGRHASQRRGVAARRRAR